MRVFQIITIKDPPLCLTWARKVFAYIQPLPGSTINIIFDDYYCEDDTFLNPSKRALTSSTKKNIYSLNQVLPKSSEWSEFHYSNKNKFQLLNLLADFFTST